MNPTALSNLGDLKPGLEVHVVHVHTKARTDVCAKERRNEVRPDRFQ